MARRTRKRALNGEVHMKDYSFSEGNAIVNEPWKYIEGEENWGETKF